VEEVWRREWIVILMYCRYACPCTVYMV
jgi:hypothetical protein